MEQCKSGYNNIIKVAVLSLIMTVAMSMGVLSVFAALMSLGAAILLFRSRRKDKKSGISRSDKKYVSKH